MTNRRDDRYDDAGRMDDQRSGTRRQDGRGWQAESNASPDVLRYDEDLGYTARDNRSGQGQWAQGQGSQGPWDGDRSSGYGRGMGGHQGQGYGRQMGGDAQWRGGSQGGSSSYGQGRYGQGGDRMRRYMDDNQGYGTENEDYSYMRQEQYGQGQGMGRGWRDGGYGGQDSEMRFRPAPQGQYSQQGMSQDWSGMGNQSQRSSQGMMQGQSHQGKGPKGYQRSDDRIRESVNDALEDDHGIDASDIEVQVQGGEVTLTGTVTDRMQKRRAEDVVESLRGVRDVHNQLRVSAQGQGLQNQSQSSPVISSSQTSSGSPSPSGQGQGGAGTTSSGSGGLSASSVRISDDVSRR